MIKLKYSGWVCWKEYTPPQNSYGYTQEPAKTIYFEPFGRKKIDPFTESESYFYPVLAAAGLKEFRTELFDLLGMPK